MLKKKRAGSIIEYFDRESPEAIEMRRVFNYLISKSDKKNNILNNFAITSATLGEGKSTIASLLAISIADHSKSNVLLVDVDFRRPRLHDIFSIKLAGGISDILSGESIDNFILKSASFENLKIITAGKRLSNPISLLDTGKLKSFFDKMRYHFDYIILDCPPVIPVSDIMDIAPEIDGVLMVVKAGQTPKDVAKRAVNLLKNYGINILGCILNDTEKVLPYYYDYSYYRYSSRQDKPSRQKSPRKQKATA